MAFKKQPRLKIPYRKQGLIYFTLLNYESQPEKVREHIDELIRKAADGDAAYEAALRDWLLSDEPVQKIAFKHYISTDTLYRLRIKVYENW